MRISHMTDHELHEALLDAYEQWDRDRTWSHYGLRVEKLLSEALRRLSDRRGDTLWCSKCGAPRY